MHFEELISHPYLHPLVNKFPKIELKMNIIYFVWRGYIGMGLRCLRSFRFLPITYTHKPQTNTP